MHAKPLPPNEPHSCLARMLPLLVWIACLALTSRASGAWLLASHGLQTIATIALLAFYWSQLPNLRPHFKGAPLGILSAVFLLPIWVLSHWLISGEWDSRIASPLQSQQSDHTPMALMIDEQPTLGWSLFVLRTLGMTLIVPLIEESFFRDLALRSSIHPKVVIHSIKNILSDLCPSIAPSRGAGVEYAATAIPLGTPSAFALVISTLLFAANHHWIDWTGAVICGITWCIFVFYTKSLATVLWSHAAVNLGLAIWCAYSGNWQLI